MADQHHYTVSINGFDYDVDSDKELTDAQAYQYAKSQHDSSPEARKAGNEQLKAVNAEAAAHPTAMEKPTLWSYAKDVIKGNPITGPLVDAKNDVVAGNYAKAGHNVIKGLGTAAAIGAAPFVLADPASWPAAAAAVAGGAVGDVATRAGARALGATPDQEDLAGDIGGLAAGGFAGSKVPKVPAATVLDATGRMLESPKSTRQLIGSALRKVSGKNVPVPEVKPPVPTASELLGVSPNATGAVMDSLPETAPLARRPAIAVNPNASRTNPVVTPEGDDLNTAASQMGVSLRPGAGGLDAASAGTQHDLQAELMRRRAAVPGEPPVVPDGGPGPRQPIPNPPTRAGRTEAPNPSQVTADYAQQNGLPAPEAHAPVKVDPAHAMDVADAYDAMPHDPSNPDVKAAYDALSKEVNAQYDHILKSGLKVEPAPPGGGYKSSKEMANDVRMNNHLYYEPTEVAGDLPADHPMAATDESGMPLNDKFRIVHDYIAHAGPGNDFGANGEMNAYLEHLKTLSEPAGRALATETKGQNSFVNFGEHMRGEDGALLTKGDPGYLAPGDRPFAPQKAGLLPPELTPEVGRGVPKASKGKTGGQTAAQKKTAEDAATKLMAEIAKRHPKDSK